MVRPAFDEEVRMYFTQMEKSEVKGASVGQLMQSYYLGLPINECQGDAGEIADGLGMSDDEYAYWEDLAYKKDSWLNKWVEEV